jgi:hypothetical protein
MWLGRSEGRIRMAVGVNNTIMKICDAGECGVLYRRKSGEFFAEEEDGTRTTIPEGRFGENIWRFMVKLFSDDPKFTDYWMTEELIRKLRQDKEKEHADTRSETVHV